MELQQGKLSRFRRLARILKLPVPAGQALLQLSQLGFQPLTQGLQFQFMGALQCSRGPLQLLQLTISCFLLPLPLVFG